MHEHTVSQPIDNESAEIEQSLSEQLHAAALDLRSAIRRQVAKTQEFYNKKQLVEYDKRKQAVKRQGGDPKLAEEPQQINEVETRLRVRDLFRLPLGTEETADGRLIRHFTYIYEDEVSAQQPENAHEAYLTLVHVKKQSTHDEGMRGSVYNISIVGNTVSVSEGARLLEENELEKPLRLIQAAKELYI